MYFSTFMHLICNKDIDHKKLWNAVFMKNEMFLLQDMDDIV